MKYDITYSCGHEGKIELFGKGSDRERKIAWYKETAICPDCFRAQKEAEKQAMNEKAQSEATANNLPVLTGTEKQVAWATTIRQIFIETYKPKGENIHPNAHKAFEFMIATATSAAEWIENREYFEQKAMIKKYTEQYMQQA